MNNKKKNEMGGVWRGRVAGLLICTLFAVGFGGFGLHALWSVTTMLHSGWLARSWQQVPVEVLESSVRRSSNGDGGITHTVHARYRYEWAGRTYESTRVGLASDMSGDNIDGWHQDWDPV